MTLNEWLAQTKNELYRQIVAGGQLDKGTYDQARLDDLRSKGDAQIGTAVLAPHQVSLEFIFRMPAGQTEVLTVQLEPPQRIVFMPVPEWVIESVWQGEVLGSHHFESDAMALMERFGKLLEKEENVAQFGEQRHIGRK